MKVSLQNIIFLVLIVNVLSSCSFVGLKTSNKKELTEQQNLELKNFFVEANKQKMLGNLNDAVALFGKCISIDHSDAASMYEIANIYASQGEFEGALHFAKNAVKTNPDNAWYQLLLAAIYEKTAEVDKAVDIYEILIANSPKVIENYFAIEKIHSDSKNYNDAIKILDRVEQQFGFSENVSLEKERLYRLSKQNDKALNEIKKLTEQFPDNITYMGILAEGYVEQLEYVKAKDIYDKLLGKYPDNGVVNLSLADFYRLRSDYDNYFKYLKIAFSSKDIDVDSKVKIIAGIITISIKDKEIIKHADELLQIILKAHPEDVKVLTVYADYLSLVNKNEEAKDYYLKVTNTVKDKYMIWEQLLVVQNLLKDYEGMLKSSNEALEYFPNKPLLYIFNSEAYKNLNNYSEAVKQLEIGKELVIDNDKLLKEFKLYLAEAYNLNKQFAKSDVMYDQFLKADPDNKYVLNNYSYYLSLRAEKLDKAELMIKKCLELSPNNSNYLDTYAWVLFKARKYSEALKIIEEAINFGGNTSAVVIEHYGDILYKNGKVGKAIENWKKSKELGNNSEDLENKIIEGKLVD